MENKSVFYILNEKQRVIGIGSNNSPDSLPYFEDFLIESIETGVVTYEFNVPANHAESGKLIANNHVVVRDLDGNFLLFTIKEVMESHEDGKLIKKVFCENTAVTEMLGQVVEPQTIPSATLANAIKTLFKGVKEWSAIDMPYTEGRDVVISEHTNLLEVLNDLTNLYGLEMYFTVELANVVIKKKIVNFRKKRGQETDLRFEYGLNLAGVTRKEDSTGVITALYGIGKGGNDNTISLKNYKHVDDGDIVHLAQTDVVSSREALNRWGRNGQHIYGIYKSDKADTVEQLYKETLEELKRRVNPILTYEASVVTLERITGYDGQKLRIGDRVLVIDKTFNPAILLSARVVELQRSFTNPTNDAVKLGEYRPLKPTLSKLLKDVQTSTNQAVKYPDLPKIQQDFTESVINPIKTVVDDIEEEVEETVQAVVNIQASVEGMQADYSEIKEVIKDVKIYKQDTPPTGVSIDTLWINISEKPNFMYRWDGTAWQPLAPATAEDIGAIGNDFFNEKMEEIDGETAKINAAIKATDGKVSTMQTDLANKVDATWVNGQLVSKANVGDSYTKKESDNALNGKVSTTTYTTDKNGIITRLDSAETRVTQSEEKIKLTATKDELTQASDGLTSKINKVSSDLTVQAGLIEGKVSNSTYTTDKAANETRFKNAESRLTQTEKDITAKVNSTDVYKKTEVDSKVNAKVDTTVYNNKIASIEATNNSITQKVEEVNSTVSGLSVGGRNLVLDTMFTQGTKYWSGLTSGTVIDVTGVPNVKKGLRLANTTTFVTQVMDIVPFTQNTKGYMSGYVKVDALTAGTEFPRIYLRFTYNQNGTDKMYYVIASQKTTTDGFVRLSLPFDLTKYEGTLKDVRINFATANTTTVDATFAGIMVMFGDFVTSFVQAPEDIDTSIDSKVNTEDYNKKVAEIKVTTDGISQTVSDVNKTVTAQGTRLSTAESAITQANTQIGLKVNATDVYKKTEIDPKLNAKVDTTTYNNKMAELKITTDNISQSVSSVTNTVNGMDIGGRNLLLLSDKKFTDTTDYLINQYTLTENFVTGEEYTFVIKGSVTAGQKLGIWQNGGSTNVGYATTVYSNGVTYVTFKAQATTAGNERKLSLYNFPQNTTKATVEWVALYKGNMPMDWTPSPDDVNSAIGSKVDTSTYTSKMSSIDTSINGITQRVGTVESTTTGLGSRMTTAEASIKTQAGQISSKVESTTYNTDMNGLKGRVSTAETWINQTKTDITLLAKKNEVGSLLNQSPDGFKILGKYLDISGLVTFTTFDKSTQDKINAIDTKAGDGVTKANAAQTTANTANSTANTAKSNAATAQTAANAAQGTANTANGTANSIKTRTDAWVINSTQINGAAIATGTVTANQLNVNNIFANSAVVSAISAYSINADKIKSGKISGVTYESLNASNPKIKVVIEGNTVKSYGAVDSVTKAQNYSELKEGGVAVFQVAETGSPFGDKKATVEPARFNAVVGSRSSALEPTELRFWVPNQVGKISYDVTPHNNSGYGLRVEAPGGLHILANNNSKSALSFEAKGAVWHDGWGNIWGDPYGAGNSTWSVKDGSGRVKFLVPVGPNAGGPIELQGHGSGIDFLYNSYRFMSFWGDSVNRVIRFGDGGQLKWQHNQGRFEFRNFDDGNWSNAAAGSFTNASSFKWKTDIKNFEGNATDIIANSDIMTFKMKPSENKETNEIPDISTLHTHIGLIAEYAPKEVQSEDGAGVDLYAMISVAWKSIQELKTEIKEIKAENALLKAQLVGTNN
ncbi:phage tail spike protein [Bacillus wiedmannii]|uniref:phage tail spike protein n=2 Tax=Bacillus wiedmannii TaxID=1890302 RepID=UPI000BEF9338|nr:phage tail spike protein [Bacillus wiedmannii]PEJ48423.1 hypothetical protein CN672_13855 [Bacillus wiedmannii]PEM10291.1 hypothetical protein CN610_13975 [Bacillus wiedmannii]PGD08256.1 hypothetical protein COM34_14235 [Bacillus wiedmannii]